MSEEKKEPEQLELPLEFPEGHDEEANGVRLADEERQECEQWTRVMGYFRPVDGFNIGKKQEFKDRKYFSQDKAKKYLEQ